KSRAANSPRNLGTGAGLLVGSASAAATRLCSIISITSRSPLGKIVRGTSQIVKRSIEFLTWTPETGILASDDRASGASRALRSIRPGRAGGGQRTPG